MPRITVGVDAGGSKTAAVYAVDGKPVRVWVAGAANASVRGTEAASVTIGESIEQALDGAIPAAIFVGAAGAGREDVADGIRSALESRFTGARVEVRDDAYIALRAAIPEGDGVVLIAGTGSIAYAEHGGETYRCGGYGYLIGDEGSGFAIGAAGVKHLMRAYDGRVPRDALTEELERRLGSAGAVDVLGQVYRAPHPVGLLAEIASIVLDVANRGERSAQRIVQSASQELADLVKSVIKIAGLAGTQAPIALSGGLLGGNSLLTYLLETRLLNDFPNMPIRKENPESYLGALALAEKLIG